MSNNTQPLDERGWSEHYNLKILDGVVRSIETGEVSVWSKELVQLTDAGRRDSFCLEIGCGSGASSLWLAKQGRRVTALDYSESLLELIGMKEIIRRKPNLTEMLNQDWDYQRIREMLSPEIQKSTALLRDALK